MVKVKILFDTCVLIAASTFYVSEDIEVPPLVHPFYEQSKDLVEYIKENLEKRIGIVTARIEGQCPGALHSAIEEVLMGMKTQDRRKYFPHFSTILDFCENRLKKDILPYLVREPVDEDAVKSNYQFVDKIYEELAGEAIRRGYMERRYERWTEAAARRFKRLARDIYKEREIKEDFQLFHLIKKPVETSDKFILSEAVYLFQLHYRMEEEMVAFYLASTDHHFSPKRWIGGIESREVTNRIEQKFGIVCDWPQQIKKLATETLTRVNKDV